MSVVIPLPHGEDRNIWLNQFMQLIRLILGTVMGNL
jgi:hypothetical protein